MYFIFFEFLANQFLFFLEKAMGEGPQGNLRNY